MSFEEIVKECMEDEEYCQTLQAIVKFLENHEGKPIDDAILDALKKEFDNDTMFYDNQRSSFVELGWKEGGKCLKSTKCDNIMSDNNQLSLWYYQLENPNKKVINTANIKRYNDYSLKIIERNNYRRKLITPNTPEHQELKYLELDMGAYANLLQQADMVRQRFLPLLTKMPDSDEFVAATNVKNVWHSPFNQTATNKGTNT